MVASRDDIRRRLLHRLCGSLADLERGSKGAQMALKAISGLSAAHVLSCRR